MLSASARTNNVRLRLGVAGAWLTCNLTRLLHWRPDDTKAVERSMLKVCIVEEATRYKRTDKVSKMWLQSAQLTNLYTDAKMLGTEEPLNEYHMGRMCGLWECSGY